MDCITLISDFGLQDASVAAAKGILMQHMPQVSIVDISHMVTPHQETQAAYLLLSAYKNFPAGSCHVALVNIFYAKQPKIVFCEKDGHYFIAPDNGILPLAFNKTEGYAHYTWQKDTTFKTWLHETGLLIKKIKAGEIPDGYEAITMQHSNNSFSPRVSPTMVECRVIHIDRYENVLVNITKEQFETAANGRSFRIEYVRGESITTINNNYTDVRPGDKLCRFNSSGFLEIAINKGAAASLFGLKVYQEQHLIYNTIKIIFE